MSSIQFSNTYNSYNKISPKASIFLFRIAFISSVALALIGLLGTLGVLPIGIAGPIILGLSASFILMLSFIRCCAMRREEKHVSVGTHFGNRRSQAILPQWNSCWYSFVTSSCFTQVSHFFFYDNINALGRPSKKNKPNIEEEGREMTRYDATYPTDI